MYSSGLSGEDCLTGLMEGFRTNPSVSVRKKYGVELLDLALSSWC